MSNLELLLQKFAQQPSPMMPMTDAQEPEEPEVAQYTPEPELEPEDPVDYEPPLEEALGYKQNNSLINQWKKAPSPQVFEQLYKENEGAINRGMYMFAGGYNNPLPKAATKAHALNAFNDAINTFDPNKGVALSSWITSKMRTLQRYVRDNKDIAHIPENRLIHVGMLREREMFLTDRLGRQPSLAELADDLKWPVKKVKMIKGELRRDLMGNRGLDEMAQKTSGKVEALLRGLYYDVPPFQQKILEYTFGWGGEDKLQIKDIAKRMKVPEAKVRYEKDKLAHRIQKDYANELARL
jgi:DNA-directed RNA polymerase specialized sigma subunit